MNKNKRLFDRQKKRISKLERQIFNVDERGNFKENNENKEKDI